MDWQKALGSAPLGWCLGIENGCLLAVLRVGLFLGLLKEADPAVGEVTARGVICYSAVHCRAQAILCSWWDTIPLSSLCISALIIVTIPKISRISNHFSVISIPWELKVITVWSNEGTVQRKLNFQRSQTSEFITPHFQQDGSPNALFNFCKFIKLFVEVHLWILISLWDLFHQRPFCCNTNSTKFACTEQGNCHKKKNSYNFWALPLCSPPKHDWIECQQKKSNASHYYRQTNFISIQYHHQLAYPYNKRHNQRNNK